MLLGCPLNPYPKRHNPMTYLPDDADRLDADDEAFEELMDELDAPATPESPEALIGPDGDIDVRKAWLAVYRQGRASAAWMVRRGYTTPNTAKLLVRRLTPKRFEVLLDRARLIKALASLRDAGKAGKVHTFAENEMDAFEQDLLQWTERLQWAGVTPKIADIDELDYEDHPLREAIWQRMDPEDFSRRQLQSAHSRWIRQQTKAQAAIEQRRDAGLASAGLTREVWELKQKEKATEAAEAIKAAKADRLYIDAATAVLESWKAKGASLPGVRWPLRGTSKPVRWLKAITEGRERWTVKRDAQRMADKTKGWEADLDAYRAWKG